MLPVNTILMMPAIRSIIWPASVQCPFIWKSLVWMWRFPETVIIGYDIVETAKRTSRSTAINSCIWMSRNVCTNSDTIALKEKLAALKEDLEAFNVTFDVWFSEQTLHDADKINEACELLTERGYMYEKDGALWLKATAYGDDKTAS